jgi:tellurite resistance protein TehA-like permease
MRLAIKKIPKSEKMGSLMIPLGPLGLGGFVALRLGEEVLRVAPHVKILPMIWEENKLLVGSICYTVGVMTAVTLWGFGLLWLSFGVLCIVQKRGSFNLTWWALVPALGFFALSSLTIGVHLPSRGFLIFGTVLTAVVFLLWLFFSYLTISRTLANDKLAIYDALELVDVENQYVQDLEPPCLWVGLVSVLKTMWRLVFFRSELGDEARN